MDQDYLLLLDYGVTFAITLSQVLVFGYVEYRWESGWIVSLLIALYLFIQRGTFIPTMISLGGLVMTNINQPKIGYTFFFILELIYVFGKNHKVGESEDVHFNPHEKKIRQYLLKKDPSMLSRVDNLLSKYSGREDELLRKLRSKYEITKHTAPRTLSPEPLEQAHSAAPTPLPVSTTSPSLNSKWGPFGVATSPPPSMIVQPRSSSSNQNISGRYGHLERESESDDSDESHEEKSTVALERQRETVQGKNVSSNYHQSAQPRMSSNLFYQANPERESVVFHGQTYEVDEAKRKAKEAMQRRINDRLGR